MTSRLPSLRGHLMAAGAVLLAVAACAQPQPQRPATPAASPQASFTFAPSPGPIPTGAVPYAALATAHDFADAWIRRDLPRDAWRSAISAHATTAHAERLHSTDPAALPARFLTGTVTAYAVAPSSIKFAVRTDAGTLDMTAIPVDGQWRIDAADLR